MTRQLDLSPTIARAILKRRRERDPCYRVLPSPTQERFFRSQKPFRLLTGGNQNGKTFWVSLEAAMMLRGIHPHRPSYGPIKMLILCVSRKQAAEIFGGYLLEGSKIAGTPDEFPMIPKREIKSVGYNHAGIKVPLKIELKNGSTALFAWSGSYNADELVQGMKFDVIVMDEDACEMKLWQELQPRLAIRHSQTPWGGCVLWSATGIRPNDVYHDFVKRSKAGDPDMEMFVFEPGENKSLSDDAIARMVRNLSPEQQKIRIYGTATGLDLVNIFPMWDDGRNVAMTDYEPGPYDNLWVSIDPGYRNYFGILCCAINRETPQTVRIVRYFANRRLTVRQNMEFLDDWLDGRFLTGVVVDQAGAITEKTSGTSVIAQIQEILDEKRIESKRGILFKHNYRDQGIPVVQDYIEKGLLIVNPTSEGCGLYREQMLKYRKRPDTAYSGSGGVVDKDTEGPDTTRYLLVRQPTWDDYGPNLAHGKVLATSNAAVAAVEELTAEQRIHRQRLERSAKRMAEEASSGEMREIGTGYLRF